MSELKITNDDKEWVHHAFQWLNESFGYPSPDSPLYLFNKEYFPKTFGRTQIGLYLLLEDLTKLIGLKSDHFQIEFEDDLRTSGGIPFQSSADEIECIADIVDSNDKKILTVRLKRHLVNHPGQLLSKLIIELIILRLIQMGFEEFNNLQSNHIVYIIAIRFGFGVILSQFLVEFGNSNAGIWTENWHFVSEMPPVIMAYSLAIHFDMIKNTDAGWQSFVPAYFREEYSKAITMLHSSSNPLYQEGELKARILFSDADRQTQNQNLETAIETLQKALFLTQDEIFKADIYNNIGYYQIMLKQYDKSIHNFQKALNIYPSHAYANDNLGFAFIHLGDLKSAKFYLDTAMQCEGNHAGYSYRNLALYHQKLGELEEAERNFEKALENSDNSVDLLDYYFGCFLLEQGRKEEAATYLKRSASKGEQEAIHLLSQTRL